MCEQHRSREDKEEAMADSMHADLHQRTLYAHVYMQYTRVEARRTYDFRSITLTPKSVYLTTPTARLVVSKPPVIFPSPNPNPA